MDRSKAEYSHTEGVIFIDGYLDKMYRAGRRPNLKEPKSSLPSVPRATL